MAEWLRSGLQSRLHRFDSGRRLTRVTLDDMTRSEAERRAEQLQATHEDRASHRFFARPGADSDWEVVKVEMPPELRPQALTPTIDASPRPSPADDPRSAHERNVPGLPGGIG